MIHQAVGRGLLGFTQDKVAPREVEITNELTELLRLLLPRSDPSTVCSAAAKIIDKAIGLKMEMTVELTLYHCFWINCGEEFMEDCVEVIDEEAAGRVLLCTFPGLARTIKEEKQMSKFIVVKASATLEKAF